MASSKLPIIGIILGGAGFIIAIAAFIAVSVFVYKKLVKPAIPDNRTVVAEDNQGTDLRKATAVVLEMRETGLTVREHSEIELILEVQPEGEPPFQINITRAVYRLDVPNYQPGAKLQVRYNPDDLNEFSLVSTPTKKASAEKSVEDRLNQLEKLKEKGIINDSEYHRKRKDILGGL